jgi:hypothetical protein
MTTARWRLAGALGLSAALLAACSSSNDGHGEAAMSGGAGSSAGGASAAGSGGSSRPGGSTARTDGGLGGAAPSSAGTSSSGARPGSAGSAPSSGSAGDVAACRGLPFLGADAGTDSGAACAGVSLEAERVDVDMYVMMDRSVSMAEEVGATGKIRWDFVRDAVQSFVQAKEAANIGIGLQFFGQSGSRDDSLDCNVDLYSTPAVGIGPAAKVGADLVAAIEAMVPGGLTPTYPALEGAVAYGKQWARAHPGRAAVVVLVTDGFPTQCQSPVSVSAIAAVARQALQEQPPIRTYAVGIAAVDNLDTIAREGGTKAAYVVDEADFTRSFVSTLLNISSDPLACEYEIPTPNDGSLRVDLNKVQMVYTPAVGDAEEIPRAGSYSDCASSVAGGWYYDDPTAPTKIVACPCTCSRFAAGKVEIRLGCYPRRASLR